MKLKTPKPKKKILKDYQEGQRVAAENLEFHNRSLHFPFNILPYRAVPLDIAIEDLHNDDQNPTR